MSCGAGLEPQRVRAAIIPAAGLGTRLYPLTLGTAKELLPIGRYPALTTTLLEAAAAGISDLVLVSSKEKPGLRRFIEGFSLLRELDLRVRIVLQPEPAGVLDAVARGRAALKLPADAAFAVLFPDLVYLPDQTALRRLAAAHSECGKVVFGLRRASAGQLVAATAVVRLHEPLTSPAARAAAQLGRPLRIAAVHKPGPDTGTGTAGSDGEELMTTFGQISTPALDRAITAHCRSGKNAALPSLPSFPLFPLFDDTNFLAALDDLAAAGELYGVLLPGEILDLGTLPGYLDAVARFLSGAARLRGIP